MADKAKKITELSSASASSGDDLLLMVNDPSGSPETVSISKDNFFTGSVIANGSFSNLSITDTITIANAEITESNTDIGTFANVITTDTASLQTVKITGSQLKIDNTTSVTSNNATTLFGSGSHDGKLFWDVDYLYIATSNTVIKRIALSDWDV